MTLFLVYVVTGVVSGAIYSLIAICLTLSYQTTGIFNLGYGSVAFATAFVYFMVHVGVGWPVVPAAVVSVLVFAPLLGWLFDLLIFRRLSTAGEAAKAMATIGVLVFLPALCYVVENLINLAGAHLPDTTQIIEAPGLGPVPPKIWHIGVIPLSSDQIIVLAIAVLAAVGMWVLVKRTYFGLQMRALVDKPSLPALGA